jgi:hypothetical protein
MARIPVGWWASRRRVHLANGYRLTAPIVPRRNISVSVDHLLRHGFACGATGSGKTRLLRHIVLQHIHANRGFTLIDPHGDVTTEVLSYISTLAFGTGPVTEEKLAALGDKVILAQPDCQTYGVPGVNILQVGEGQVPYQVVDSIIEVIKEMWADSYGARMEDVLRNTCLLAIEFNLTFLELLPLLSDAGLRQGLAARSQNQAVRHYFEGHLGSLRNADVNAWLESSRNKVSAFVQNPFIAPCLGQAQSTIDFFDVLQQGKWLLVNVSRDRLKESRRLLGALIIALVHNAALVREHVPPEERYFHALVIDELPEFYSPTVLLALTGGRKLGLSLSVFTQTTNQPPFAENPAIMDSIISNCHTRVVFNVGRHDADRLAGDIFWPTGARPRYQRSLLGIPLEQPKCWSLAEEREHYTQQLMRQSPSEAIISFRGLRQHDPFVARVPTVPDVVPDDEKITALRQHIATRYYRPLPDISREIRERFERLSALALGTTQTGPRDYNQ